MCGRYALTLPPDAVRQYFGYAEQPNFPPRYNIAPTQPVPVVRIRQGVREFALMRWGFLPGWVKDPKDFPLVINVRSETMRDKPSFRAAVTRRRCVMPADGFYEWQQLDAEKRPYLFRRPDRGVFGFAALWECWTSPDGSEIDTVALVNGMANGLMSGVHHRCPVILEPDQMALWLDPETPVNEAAALCQPPAEDLLEMVRISRMVNSVANDGPEVQIPYDPTIAPDTKPAAAKMQPVARKRKTDDEEPQGQLF